MSDFDFTQCGLLARIAISIGVFVSCLIAALGVGVFSMFLLAVMGDSGDLRVPSSTLRLLLNAAFGFAMIGVFAPCVMLNLRGTLQSGVIAAIIGFGGTLSCLMLIVMAWAEKS